MGIKEDRYELAEDFGIKIKKEIYSITPDKFFQKIRELHVKYNSLIFLNYQSITINFPDAQ